MSASARDVKLPLFQLLEEPILSFSPDSPKKCDIHPLRGLVKFGPYSQRSFGSFSSELRIALVGPMSGRNDIVSLMKVVQKPQQPVDRPEYVPAYPGFEALFGIPLRAAQPSAWVQWPDALEDFRYSGSNEQRLAAAFQDALTKLDAVRSEFDVVVHLPDRWAHASRTEAFDAHEMLKALGAQFNIPTQVINDRSFLFATKFAASIAWRLGDCVVCQGRRNPLETICPAWCS